MNSIDNALVAFNCLQKLLENLLVLCTYKQHSPYPRPGLGIILSLASSGTHTAPRPQPKTYQSVGNVTSLAPRHSRTSKKHGNGKTDGGGQVSHMKSLAESGNGANTLVGALWASGSGGWVNAGCSISCETFIFSAHICGAMKTVVNR